MRVDDASRRLTADADFRFYVGVHHPRLAWALTLRGFRVCLSANVLTGRLGDAPFLGCDEPWFLDSGAFTQVALRGGFEQTPDDYAAMIRRFAGTGLIAASTQDYMCEPVALRATGLTVRRHQALTIARFDAIRAAGTAGVHLLPVLQGRTPDDYRRHLEGYGDRIGRGAWVGVGSLCKRQGDPEVIAVILDAILLDRPDLRLTGSAASAPRSWSRRCGPAWPRPTAWPGPMRRGSKVAIRTPGTRLGASRWGSAAAPRRSRFWPRAPGGGGRSSQTE